jgi:hypothetical protein
MLIQTVPTSRCGCEPADVPDVIQGPADRLDLYLFGAVVAKDAAKHLSRALRLAEAHEDHSGVAIIVLAGPIHVKELIPRDRPMAP